MLDSSPRHSFTRPCCAKAAPAIPTHPSNASISPISIPRISTHLPSSLRRIPHPNPSLFLIASSFPLQFAYHPALPCCDLSFSSFFLFFHFRLSCFVNFLYYFPLPVFLLHCSHLWSTVSNSIQATQRLYIPPPHSNPLKASFHDG